MASDFSFGAAAILPHAEHWTRFTSPSHILAVRHRDRRDWRDGRHRRDDTTELRSPDATQPRGSSAGATRAAPRPRSRNRRAGISADGRFRIARPGARRTLSASRGDRLAGVPHRGQRGPAGTRAGVWARHRTMGFDVRATGDRPTRPARKRCSHRDARSWRTRRKSAVRRRARAVRQFRERGRIALPGS
jgi:hypothetical protein